MRVLRSGYATANLAFTPNPSVSHTNYKTNSVLKKQQFRYREVRSNNDTLPKLNTGDNCGLLVAPLLQGLAHVRVGNMALGCCLNTSGRLVGASCGLRIVQLLVRLG